MVQERDNEVYAYATLVDTPILPDEITKRIKIQPTETWNKGDVNPQTRFERKFHRWSLYSRAPRSEEDPEVHIKDVLDQLDEHKAEAAAVCREFEAIMQVVGYFYFDKPRLHMEATTIQRLAEYGLCLDCDYYILYSDKREDSE